jgi:hypothetical protein
VIIAGRYNGPPGSGNGGYTCGLLASHVIDHVPGHAPGHAPGHGAVVTLKLPPPLDTPLTVTPLTDDGHAVRVTDPGGAEIAVAVRGSTDDPELPPPMSWADAVTASAAYRGFASHPFPTCFVCGPERAPGDGMRLFPGPVGDGRTATPWEVPDDISPELVWAALDCPGGWAVPLEERPYVLGRMDGLVNALPRPGDRCVVIGQMITEDGRKAFVRTALYGPDGTALAWAKATWIALRQP